MSLLISGQISKGQTSKSQKLGTIVCRITFFLPVFGSTTDSTRKLSREQKRGYSRTIIIGRRTVAGCCVGLGRQHVPCCAHWKKVPSSYRCVSPEKEEESPEALSAAAVSTRFCSTRARTRRSHASRAGGSSAPEIWSWRPVL